VIHRSLPLRLLLIALWTAAAALCFAACDRAPVYPAGWPLAELTIPEGASRIELKSGDGGRWVATYRKSGVPLSVVERISGPLKDAGWQRDMDGIQARPGEVREVYVSQDGRWRVVLHAKPLPPRRIGRRSRPSRFADYTYTITGPSQ
jgi:hypothetical protein